MQTPLQRVKKQPQGNRRKKSKKEIKERNRRKKLKKEIGERKGAN